MPVLVILSPAPVQSAPGGDLWLDPRFVDGMSLHSQFWPGRVYCVLWHGERLGPEARRYSVDALGFKPVFLPRGANVPDSVLDEATLVYASLEDPRHLALVKAMRGRIGRLVFLLGQSALERLRLALAQGQKRSGLRRFGPVLWALGYERALRQALREADGVHLNGAAAASAYARLNPNTLMFFDNRLRRNALASAEEQDARAARLAAGARLQLAALVSPETGSGAEDLVAIAHLARNLDVSFRMDIFASEPLLAALQRRITVLGLSACVRVLQPGDFDAVFSPYLRKMVDLVLMPSRLPQGPDAYLEAMGSGVPVLGYTTPGWRRLASASGGGWAVAARPSAMARALKELAQNRAALIAASARGRAFAERHVFETVFARRMHHLRTVAGLELSQTEAF